VRLPDITLAAGTSMTVSVEGSDDSTFATNKQSFVLGTFTPGKIEGQKLYAKLSEKPKRYWRAVVTTSDTTGDLSASNAKLSIAF
jgi:hypothetical protein